MTETREETTWKGWSRESRKRPWRCVVEGSDEDDVHRRLLTAVQQSGDFFVAKADGNPNEQKAPR